MITKVEYIKDYQLRVYFDDGIIKDIDMYPFMSNSTMLSVRKFLDLKKFKKVRVDYGTIAWGDNEFDINPVSIYEGRFDIGTRKRRFNSYTTRKRKKIYDNKRRVKSLA
jgi:hypothetical protein